MCVCVCGGGGDGDGKGDMLGREKGTNTECSAKPYILFKR